MGEILITEIGEHIGSVYKKEIAYNCDFCYLLAKNACISAKTRVAVFKNSFYLTSTCIATPERKNDEIQTYWNLHSWESGPGEHESFRLQQ